MSTTATWCTPTGNNSLVAVTPFFQLCGRLLLDTSLGPQFQLGAPRPPLQCAACFLDAAACFARLALVSDRNAACSFSATCSGSTCSFSTMSGASVRTGTRIPRIVLAANGLQVLRMLSGDHHGVDFRGARQIRTRTSPGPVLLCTQHRCLSHPRCS